ncbi:flagellar basal-body rod protein FlgB [Jhaorihella thermophila]|uniref:Flagellar basal body rod protein FlgB n=3 Tax=Jhaorihella thermophila TaxID=488547 RepID=A0A1H5XTF9_9RHOB|nr:flagellar basal-body rod protein FlgB [Jhaorihella thermophila]
MFENLDVFRLASAMARHAAARQAVIAQNMANSDTPGFKARDIASFSAIIDDGGAMDMRATRPTHLNAREGSDAHFRTFVTDEGADPNGNTVSIEQEMLKAIEAKRSHGRALAIYKSSLNILRTAIGRG